MGTRENCYGGVVVRIFGAVGLLLLSLSCGGTQVYTTQNSELVGTDAAVAWRYTIVMDRLLVQDFDATAITQKKFLNTFTQKVMAIVHARFGNDISTALKVGSLITALQGQFPADSAEAEGLKKIVDAATTLALNPDKTQNKQLGKDFNAAVVAFFGDASLRQALATKGSFISTKLKGPPDIVADILNEEFINEVLTIEETTSLRKVLDIPTLFAELVETMHTVLNDASLMVTMSDPTIVDAASTVLNKFFTLYKELQGEKDDHNVNTIKASILSLLDNLDSQQLTALKTLSAPLWAAARSVHFKDLPPTDVCDGETWRAVRDLDGESLVGNLPETAIAALTLCRINPKTCDAWGDWGTWTPATDTVCEGETLAQTRTRQRICPDPCDGDDCETTASDTQAVGGTKVCAPVCENSCDTACTTWKVWESKAWSPATDTVCGGETMRQRKSRVQRRSCSNLCESKDCPTFIILAPSKRSVEGTRDCHVPPPPPPLTPTSPPPPYVPPPPTCKCCDERNNEITSCPRDSRFAWDSETCSCASTCSQDAVMSCGGIFSSGKERNSPALDENCECFWGTTRQSWTNALLYSSLAGRPLLDLACALRNVDAFKDDANGRKMRADLWDDGCINHRTLRMGCRATKTTAMRQKFIDFHDRTLTQQTEGYWGIGCSQVFSDRQTFERGVVRAILSCGDHPYSLAAWEQIGKPPRFDRLYRRKNPDYQWQRGEVWGQHLRMCVSD